MFKTSLARSCARIPLGFSPSPPGRLTALSCQAGSQA